MTEELEKAIKVLAKKVDEDVNANDVLKYTQAALNAAHTLHVLKQVQVK